MCKPLFVPKYMIEALILELRNICSELENLNDKLDRIDKHMPSNKWYDQILGSVK